MLSLLYLKHAFNLSDEALVERWAENVYWQFFSGMEHFEPQLPCDATQVGRFRSAIGEAGVEELLEATIDCAVESTAVKPAEFSRVIVDTTVQKKAIAYEQARRPARAGSGVPEQGQGAAALRVRCEGGRGGHRHAA